MAEDLSRPAFRYPSSGRRPERLNQSRNVNAPLQLLRGWAAGTLGLPGDIEGLVRMLPGIENETPVLPTSDFYREYLPGYDERPAARAMSGLGALTGGMGSTRVAREGLGAVKRATDVNAIRNYVRSAQGLSGMPGTAVVKPKGGNWLAGAQSPEASVQRLRNADVDERAYMEFNREQARSGGEFQDWLTQRWREDPNYRKTPAIQAANEFLRSKGLSPLAPEGPDAALNKWIDQKLARYVRNEMGTPEDPLRALAGEGASHLPAETLLEFAGRGPAPDVAYARKAAGYPELGFVEENAGDLYGGLTDQQRMAIGWENVADAPIASDKAGELAGIQSVLDQNPWLAKVAPETPVYNLLPGSTVRNENLGFPHLIDELRNAVNPESGLPRELLWKYSDLDKVTVPQAVQRVSDINKWRAAQAEKARLEGMLSADVYKAYPEQDMRWVQLNRPGQFAAESEAMGHSVRGYEPREGGGYSSYGHGGWDAIKEGRAKIYSLRDKRGEPHVTIEVKPGRQLTERDLPDDVRDMLAEQYGDASREEFEAAVQAYLRQRSVPDEITQIKGKGNRAPKEEYLPMVQDFVRSGQWGRVGDVENTGMRPMREVFNNAELEMLKKAGAELPEHGYLTGEQIQQLHNVVVPEGQRLKYDFRGNIVGSESRNFARGGAVTATPEYDPLAIDALADELLAAA